ncbi:MAG: hypothetical protein U0M60_12615, partial [Clostridia bacterium]|nr:hypothetical protein [Clostridia bacterium]
MINILELKIVNKNGDELLYQKGESIKAEYFSTYNEGDKIVLKTKMCDFVEVKFDETMPESIVFVPGSGFEFEIPFGGLMAGYSPDAFSGEKHIISAKEADEYAYEARNIALNSHDRRGQKKYYPHVYANLVTREAPCFFERNAIDGVCDNSCHGDYPYHSWAAGAREDMEYYIDFGSEVEVEKLVFFLRADFPHDTYWRSLTVEFSDGTREVVDFVKTADGQELILPEPKITKIVHLTDFKQAEYPFSWAALSQVEVYGKYIKEDFSKMEIRSASNPKDVKHYTTERLREEFHISKLFTKDNIRMVYSHIDRIITAGLMPVKAELKLEGGKELASDYFLERREMGCINVG